jgi:hypothetical protein
MTPWSLTTGALLLCISSSPPVDFDREIQPLLNRCTPCHGQDKAKAGLRLSRRPDALAELDSGNRAIVPGKPEDSELLNRVLDAHSKRRMPPEGPPLTVPQIDALRRWIAAGADWPEHWAYRPLKRPDAPRTIDWFIDRKLAEMRLKPSPPADRRTLLRRVSLDLTGLPPTAAEVDAFIADQSPDAYERVVDRLLASPRYGERWARHWMDLVHYAETHGHDQDRPREHAWPYRDYLIRSFNDDKPYTRFVEEQVAGDVLFPEEPWATVATGFLATGAWDESSLRDIREDGIDREIGRNLDRDDIATTVMSTFVSSTVHCARCHDHKFDPIRQDEYYGVQAVFAGVDKADRPYDVDPEVAVRRRRLAERETLLERRGADFDRLVREPATQAEIAAWEKERKTAVSWQILELSSCKSESGATLTPRPDRSVLSEGPRPEKDTYTVVAHTDLRGVTAVRLELLTDDSLPHKGPGRQDNGNLHLNEFTLEVSPSAGGPAKPVAWLSAAADFDQQDWTVAKSIDGNPATAWGVYPEIGKPHLAVFTLKEPLPNAAGSTLSFRLQQTHGGGHLIGRFRLAVTAAAHPAVARPLPEPVASILAVAANDRTDRQRSDLAAYILREQLDRDRAALPQQSLVYSGTNRFAPDGSFKPADKPRPIYVLQRGDVRKRGALVKPGALACLTSVSYRIPTNPDDEGARRVALAHWLSDPANVLTWRSIANRVWQWHFGRGLVDTPNDFGRMGSPPTHPELLDWLAFTLQQNGGSLKKLHRLIVTSAAYRRSVDHSPACAAVDADNAFYWRMNRQRLDAESIHDALLRISAKLDLTMGGPSLKQFHQSPGVHVTPTLDYQSFDPDDPANFRRSVYRFVFRTLPDPFMDSLDCPDGNQLAPTRGASVTALQALTLLNDKFIVRQSEHIADRIARTQTDPDRRVEEAYRLILLRAPTPKESTRVAAYAAKHGLANACRMLLNSNEFLFVD